MDHITASVFSDLSWEMLGRCLEVPNPTQTMPCFPPQLVRMEPSRGPGLGVPGQEDQVFLLILEAFLDPIGWCGDAFITLPNQGLNMRSQLPKKNGSWSLAPQLYTSMAFAGTATWLCPFSNCSSCATNTSSNSCLAVENWGWVSNYTSRDANSNLTQFVVSYIKGK